MSIDELPLPPKAITLLKEHGIIQLFPPQEEAINRGLLKRKNLVLAVPTASGKTLVAELAMIKNLFEAHGKCLYLVPLRALANEKYTEFKKYEQLGYRVGMTTGDYDSTDEWLENYDIIVSTNEKVDSLIRHHARWLSDLGLIVSDEVHLMNDLDRGATLEIVITRLRELNPNAQILALSATIKNANELGEWLEAEVIYSNWRPVELREGVCYQTTVWYDENTTEKLPRIEKNPLINIMLNTLSKGGQVLVFTNTRQSSVSLAKKSARYVERTLSKNEKSDLAKISENLIKSTSKTKITQLLSSLIKSGVAFHHAGLSYSERLIIENAFRENKLKVLTATPTLAAGVNLPARVVVINSFHRYDMRHGYSQIPVLEYKQMAGRAGRPKYDNVGYAYLMAKTKTQVFELLEKYIHGEPESISSKLASYDVLLSHVLGCIAAEYCHSLKSIFSFFTKTFYGYQEGGIQGIQRSIKKSIDFLTENLFIRSTAKGYVATAFGKRVSELYISPETGLIYRQALSRRPTTDFGYLHLIAHTPDMPKLYLRKNEYETYEYVLEDHYDELLIDIPDAFEYPHEYESILAELKVADVLNDWINERSEDYIVEKFDIGSGDIYRLVENANWLLYSLSEIARILRKEEHVSTVKQLVYRVKHGVKSDLLPLVNIEGIGRVRARILFNAGYTSLDKLKKAKVEDIAKLPQFGKTLAEKIILAARNYT